MDELSLLQKVKAYIEKQEVTVDGEWGEGRDVKRIIEDGEMPKLYDEVCARIDELAK